MMCTLRDALRAKDPNPETPPSSAVVGRVKDGPSRGLVIKAIMCAPRPAPYTVRQSGVTSSPNGKVTGQTDRPLLRLTLKRGVPPTFTLSSTLPRPSNTPIGSSGTTLRLPGTSIGPSIVTPCLPSTPIGPSGATPRLPSTPIGPSGVTPRPTSTPIGPSIVTPRLPRTPIGPSGATPRLPSTPIGPSGATPRLPSTPIGPSGANPRLPSTPIGPSGATPRPPSTPIGPSGTTPRPTIGLVNQLLAAPNNHIWASNGRVNQNKSTGSNTDSKAQLSGKHPLLTSHLTGNFNRQAQSKIDVLKPGLNPPHDESTTLMHSTVTSVTCNRLSQDRMSTAAVSPRTKLSLEKFPVNGLSRDKVSLNGLYNDKILVNFKLPDKKSVNGFSNDKITVNLQSNGETLSNGLLQDRKFVSGLFQDKISINGLSGEKISLNGLSGEKISLNGLSSNKITVSKVPQNKVTVNGLTLDKSSVNGLSLDKPSLASGLSQNKITINGLSSDKISVSESPHDKTSATPLSQCPGVTPNRLAFILTLSSQQMNRKRTLVTSGLDTDVAQDKTKKMKTTDEEYEELERKEAKQKANFDASPKGLAPLPCRLSPVLSTNDDHRQTDSTQSYCPPENALCPYPPFEETAQHPTVMLDEEGQVVGGSFLRGLAAITPSPSPPLPYTVVSQLEDQLSKENIGGLNPKLESYKQGLARGIEEFLGHSFPIENFSPPEPVTECLNHMEDVEPRTASTDRSAGFVSDKSAFSRRDDVIDFLLDTPEGFQKQSSAGFASDRLDTLPKKSFGLLSKPMSRHFTDLSEALLLDHSSGQRVDAGPSITSLVKAPDKANNDVATELLLSTRSGQLLQPCGLSREGELMLEAANGFLLYIDRSRRILFVSENVTKHLGHQQVHLLGQTIDDYIHPKDKEALLKHFDDDHLVQDLSGQCFERRTFYLGMKFTFQKPNTRAKDTGYSMVQWNVQFKIRQTKPGRRPYIKALLALCRPVRTDSVLEIRLDGTMFMSRHDLSFQFIYCDPRAVSLVGYEPSDLLGRTAYQFHCPRDILICVECHKHLMGVGSSTSGYYRFLGRTGAWVWMLTHATIIYDTSRKPQYIVCRNYVVSPEEAERELSKEKHSFERMKCMGFSLETELPLAAPRNPTSQRTLAHYTEPYCVDTDMILDKLLTSEPADVSDNMYLRARKKWKGSGEELLSIKAKKPEKERPRPRMTVLGPNGHNPSYIFPHPLDDVPSKGHMVTNSTTVQLTSAPLAIGPSTVAQPMAAKPTTGDQPMMTHQPISKPPPQAQTMSSAPVNGSSLSQRHASYTPTSKVQPLPSTLTTKGHLLQDSTMTSITTKDHASLSKSVTLDTFKGQLSQGPKVISLPTKGYSSQGQPLTAAGHKRPSSPSQNESFFSTETKVQPTAASSLRPDCPSTTSALPASSHYSSQGIFSTGHSSVPLNKPDMVMDSVISFSSEVGSDNPSESQVPSDGHFVLSESLTPGFDCLLDDAMDMTESLHTMQSMYRCQDQTALQSQEQAPYEPQVQSVYESQNQSVFQPQTQPMLESQDQSIYQSQGQPMAQSIFQSQSQMEYQSQNQSIFQPQEQSLFQSQNQDFATEKSQTAPRQHKDSIDSFLSLLDNGPADRNTLSDLQGALTSGHSDPFLNDMTSGFDLDLMEDDLTSSSMNDTLSSGTSENSPYLPDGHHADHSMGTQDGYPMQDVSAVHSSVTALAASDLDSFLNSIPVSSSECTVSSSESLPDKLSGSELSLSYTESSSDSDSSGRQSLLRTLLDKEAKNIEGPLTYKEWIVKQTFMKPKESKKGKQDDSGKASSAKRARNLRNRKSVELPLPPSASINKVRRTSTDTRRVTKELPLPPSALHADQQRNKISKSASLSEQLLTAALSSISTENSTQNDQSTDLGLPDDLLDLAMEYGSSLGTDQAEALLSELSETSNWEDTLLAFMEPSKNDSSGGLAKELARDSHTSELSQPASNHKKVTCSGPKSPMCLPIPKSKELPAYSQANTKSNASAGKAMSLLRAAVTSPDMDSLIQQIPLNQQFHKRGQFTYELREKSPHPSHSQRFKSPSCQESNTKGPSHTDVASLISAFISKDNNKNAQSPKCSSSRSSPLSKGKFSSPSSLRSNHAASPQSPRNVRSTVMDHSSTEPVSVLIMRKEHHRSRRCKSIAIQTDARPDEIYPEFEISPSDNVMYPSPGLTSFPSTPSSVDLSSPSTPGMSELERVLRGSSALHEQPTVEEESQLCGSSVPFLQRLLTGELSRDRYQKLDKQLLEKEKNESSGSEDLLH